MRIYSPVFSFARTHVYLCSLIYTFKHLCTSITDLSRKYIKKILNLLTERQSAGATQQQEQQPEQPQSQPRDSAGDGTADTGLAAFKKYVFDTQTLTMKKLSKELGLSKTVIRGYMQVLEQQGVLEKIGRTTRYTFSQEPAMTEQQTEEKAIPAQLPPSAMDTSDSSSASAPPVTNAHHGNASTSAAAAPAVVPSSSLASLRSPTRGRARGNQKSSHRMDEVDMTPPIAKRSHKAKGVSRSRHSRKRKQEELELEMEEAEAEANNNNVQAIGLAGTETGAAHGNGTIVLNGAEVSIGPAATSASTLTGQDLHENEHGMSTFSLSQDQYQVMHPDDDGSPSSTRAEVPYTIDEEEEMETQTQTQTDNDATDGKGKSNRNMGGNDRRYHGQHDDFSLSQSQPLSQSQSQPESQSQNEDFPMSPPLLNSESRQQQRHSRKKRRKTSTIKSPIYQTPW